MAATISLIMPALNAAAHIAEALDSAARQSFDGALEVIIADGGSQDATTEIARQNSFVRVLEGPDGGIYDGFNRAIAAARGDIVGFLNADDELPDGALGAVAAAFANPQGNDQSHPSYRSGPFDFLSGSVEYSQNGVIQQRLSHDSPYSSAGGLFGIPAINTRFFPRAVIEQLGPFKTNIGLAADREFLLRTATLGFKGRNMPQCLYRYRIHDGSSTIAGTPEAQQRVWTAEIGLAEALLAQDSQFHERHLAEQTRALALFKMRVNKARGNGPAPSNMAISALRKAGWQHLPAALIAWRKWRGRLSGY